MGNPHYLGLLRLLNSTDQSTQDAAIAHCRLLSMQELLELAWTLQKQISAADALENAGLNSPQLILLSSLILWVVWLLQHDPLRRDPENAIRNLSLCIETCEDTNAGIVLLSLPPERSERMLHGPLAQVRKSCHNRLTELLAAIDANNIASLGKFAPDQLVALLRWPSDHVELSLNALRLLGECGDALESPCRVAITSLANERSVMGHMSQISAAAKDALAMLDRRASQSQLSSTLLRASDAPEPDPNILLRPARGVDEVAAENLLRPASESPPRESRS